MAQLSSKAATSSIWMFSMRFLQQGIGLLQLAVLGRLLTPNDFGLMGIASLATQAIAVFVYTGYEYALVQKVDLEEIDIDTAWWVMLGRRAFIGLMLMLLAWPIARAYQETAVVPIILVMGGIQIISGLGTPAVSLMQRRLEYSKIFSFYFLSSIVSLAVGIWAAYKLRNVWALVFATGVSTSLQIFLSYIFNSYRPKWSFSKSSFAQLSDYGRWMLGSAILWFLYSQGATAFSGLIFSVTALGLYQMANRFATLPSSLFGETLLASFFPIYANLQQSKERIRLGFLKVLQLSSLIIFTTTVLVAYGLPAFFVYFLGEQWMDASELICPIAFAGGVMALLRTGSPLFLGMGKPRYQFYLDFVQTSIMIVLLYPLGRWLGPVGLPIAMLAGSIIASLVWWHGIRNSLSITTQELFKALFPASMSSIALLVVLLLSRVPVISIPFMGIDILQKTMMICFAILISIGAYIFSEKLFPGYVRVAELRGLTLDQIKHLWTKRALNSPQN